MNKFLKIWSYVNVALFLLLAIWDFIERDYSLGIAHLLVTMLICIIIMKDKVIDDLEK